MHTLHIPSVISVSTLLCLVTATASAQGRITNLRPILLPPASSSSSSVSSDASESSVASSVSSESVVVGESSSSNKAMKKTLQLKETGKSIAEHCKEIAKLYQKGGMLKTEGSPNADKFNMTMDLLAKADALCTSMEWPSSAKPLKGLKSSKSSSSSSSSSSWKMPTAPNMNACKNLGETKVVGTVHFCKMLCGVNVKIEPCPKE